MSWAAVAILAFVTLQRLGELWLSNRNMRWLIAELREARAELERYQQPELFDALVVSSPSVWWGEGYLARLLAQPLPKAALTMPVQFSVGEFEQSLGPAEEAMPEDKRELRRLRLQKRRMVDGTRELAQALAQQQGGEQLVAAGAIADHDPVATALVGGLHDKVADVLDDDGLSPFLR